MNPTAKKVIFIIIAFFIVFCPVISQSTDSISIEKFSTQLPDGKTEVQSLLNQAVESKNDSTIALKYAREALEVSKNIEYDSGIINSIRHIARIYYNHKDYDKACNSYEELFSMDSLKISLLGLSNQHYEFAELCFNMKNYRLAWENYQFALNGFIEGNERPEIAHTYEKIGLVYMAVNKSEKARGFFEDALIAFTELINHYGIFKQHSHLGDLFKDLENYKEAEEQYSKAFAQAQIMKDDTLKADIYYKLGTLFHIWEKYDEAHKYLAQSINLYKKTDHPLGVGNCTIEDARIYDKENNISVALNCYNKALSNYSTIKNKEREASTWLEKGQFLNKNGQYEPAFNSLNRALELSLEIGSGEIELAAYYEIQNYYKHLKNFKESLYYLKKYVALKDTLFNRAKEENIAKITSKYETEKKEREYEALKAEQELKEQIIAKTEFENKTLTGGIIIFVVITAYLIYLNNQRKKSNVILSHQNIDIRDKQKQIIEINEDLEKSQQKLSVINTELKELNRNLEYKVEERTSELKQSNDEMDTFLYQSSHALRRPIAQIKGLIQLAKMEKNALDLITVFEKINDTTRKMELMLQKLVLVSEIDFYMPKQEFINPEVFIKKVWKQTQKTHGKFNGNFSIRIKPGLEFYTDTKLFNITISNLIENAYLYSTINNELTPEIRVEVGETANSFVVSVADNGIGVPESALNQIFNMFYFATEKTKGYGLGLYLSSKSIRKIYGSIAILKHDKGNTVFEFSFPKDYHTKEYESIPEEFQ